MNMFYIAGFIGVFVGFVVYAKKQQWSNLIAAGGGLILGIFSLLITSAIFNETPKQVTQPAGAIVVPAQEKTAPVVQKSIGISYQRLMENIALPMQQKVRDDEGQAMAGHAQNADGGAVIIYAAIDNNMISDARITMMPSSSGNLPSDEENAHTLMQFIKNTSKDSAEVKQWFVAALRDANANPKKEFKNTFGSNQFAVIYVPELYSFELSVKPQLVDK